MAKPEEKVAKEVTMSIASFWEEPFPKAVTASSDQRTDRLLGAAEHFEEEALEKSCSSFGEGLEKFCRLHSLCANAATQLGLGTWYCDAPPLY